MANAIVRSASRNGVGRADQRSSATPMMMPSTTATTTVPLTVPRTASTILVGQPFAGIAEQAVGGGERALREPAAVAIDEEQREQRDEKQHQPMQDFAAERAGPAGDALDVHAAQPLRRRLTDR